MNTPLSIPRSIIGTGLTKKIAEFSDLSSELRAAASSDYDDLLDRVDAPLRAAIGGISVIGQVKAGKTSLLNSFMGKPEFLPSDVNPWTAVVTSLFFDKPNGPVSGADFSFFDDAQWQKFSSRDGRLAELASSIPGNQDKMGDIENEVAEMRERAEMRLGGQFHTLLGKTHKFSEASTEVLARYICAGDDPEGLVRNPVIGRFADITREANVYFKNERFGFPIKLIDTPGLNDPLLIREEITLQCLEYSDIFVLVLSAHQAFSSSDLYLLRVLNALRLDRLVVFVNRVDELTNPAEDIPDIRKHVQNMLAQENPDAHIPVLFGSAIWAEYALTGDGEVDPEKIAYFTKNQAEDVTVANSSFADTDKAGAWVASGLPALDRAVSDMLDDGIGETWLESAHIDLKNALHIINSDTKARRDTLKRQLAILNDETPPELDEDIAKQQSDFEALERKIETLFQHFKVKLEQTGHESFISVQRGLHNLIEGFIGDEVARFNEFFVTAKESKTAGAWACDPAPLRASLNRYFRREFPDVQQRILDKLDAEAGVLTNKLVNLGLSEAAQITVNTARLQDQTPNTTALSRVVSFDMGKSWWKGWFGRSKSQDNIADTLAKMIRLQFRPIEAELLNSATDKLVESSNTAISAFQDLQQTLLASRKNQAEQKRYDMSGGVDEITAKIEEMDKRATACESVAKMLEAT